MHCTIARIKEKVYFCGLLPNLQGKVLNELSIHWFNMNYFDYSVCSSKCLPLSSGFYFQKVVLGRFPFNSSDCLSLLNCNISAVRLKLQCFKNIDIL